MIEINNLTKFKIDKKLFTGIAKKVLSGENKGTRARRSLGKGGETLSLAFVSREEIKKLSKRYRAKNKPTDVLSFEGINEVVICPQIVKENAKKYGTSFEKEIKKVFLHGILHLLGYKHEKSKRRAEKMEEKEKQYLPD